MTIMLDTIRTTERRSVRPAAGNIASVEAVGALAHDVRGPLANLSLILEGLELHTRALGDAKVDAMLERAGRVIDRLEGMVNAMVERARTSGDAMTVIAEEVPVPDLVEQMTGLNQPLAQQRGVRLHCYSADPLNVIGDRHLLMQAVDNLLTNAIKHTPRGGLVVCQAMPDGDDVVIRIEDDGPGLTTEDLARAFRPFTTLSAKSDATLPSSGLGLSIVRRIAQAHGGTVKAGRARRGKGAAFTIRLPQAGCRHAAFATREMR